jgi:PadR family transcriptional regulator PadR
VPYPHFMSGVKIRLTAVIWDIVDVLANAPDDDPAWGLRICERTGYGTGTVYPALDRMLNAGYITDHWEDPPPADRPRRRYYELTANGRQWISDAVRARNERRAQWALNPGAI